MPDKILIIDDLKMVGLMLQKQGYQIVACIERGAGPGPGRDGKPRPDPSGCDDA